MKGYKVCRIEHVPLDYLATAYNAKDLITKFCCLVELEIPQNARIVRHESNSKMRCDRAFVQSIRRIAAAEEGLYAAETSLEMAWPLYTFNDFTTYVPNCWTYPDSFDDNEGVACSHGIHFFATEHEAFDFIIETIRGMYYTRLRKYLEKMRLCSMQGSFWDTDKSRVNAMPRKQYS